MSPPVVAGHRSARSRPFVRSLRLPGWAPSSWGYDAALECFWAELRTASAADLICGDAGPAGGEAPGCPASPAGPGGVVRIGPDHLITTVPGLARALARAARVPPLSVYLALTS